MFLVFCKKDLIHLIERFFLYSKIKLFHSQRIKKNSLNFDNVLICAVFYYFIYSPSSVNMKMHKIGSVQQNDFIFLTLFRLTFFQCNRQRNWEMMCQESPLNRPKMKLLHANRTSRMGSVK